MSAGVRDEKHAGRLPVDFQRLINDFIRARRLRAQRPVAAGAAPGEIDARSGNDYEARLLMLPEHDAYLTLEEVLAVRLYSGPAYQPINDFLRQIGRLSGTFRLEMARHPSLTFAATTALLCSASSELSATTLQCSPRSE